MPGATFASHRRSGRSPAAQRAAGPAATRPFAQDAETAAGDSADASETPAQSPLDAYLQRRAAIPEAGGVPVHPAGTVSHAPDTAIQRLVGFEFETNCTLTAGETERALQKDKVLLTGTGWTMTVEVIGGTVTRVVEFKVRAIDDQADPAGLEATMDDLEGFVDFLAATDGPVTLETLGKASGHTTDPQFPKTTVTPVKSGNFITARPQMTAGVSLERLVNLIEDMSKKNALFHSEGDMADTIRTGFGEAANFTALFLDLIPPGNPKNYQGFITLLASYIIAARAGGAPKYFKAAVAALSRADLGKFLAVPEIAARKDSILRDVLVVGSAKQSDLLFPEGVLNEQGEAEVRQFTIKDWIDGIVAGEDPIPWSPQLNQRGEAFGLERVGPGASQEERAQGAPIEIRSLVQGVRHTTWKSLAVFLFKYVKRLNSAEPTPFQDPTSEDNLATP
ncbi:MAG TPA: hypothetical protein VJ885_03405, partial [Thermoanaerobaculia bacterium]|nr:hypothetical protein [Thermoanaerobaculia bacterium]